MFQYVDHKTNLSAECETYYLAKYGVSQLCFESCIRQLRLFHILGFNVLMFEQNGGHCAHFSNAFRQIVFVFKISQIFIQDIIEWDYVCSVDI